MIREKAELSLDRTSLVVKLSKESDDEFIRLRAFRQLPSAHLHRPYRCCRLVHDDSREDNRNFLVSHLAKFELMPIFTCTAKGEIFLSSDVGYFQLKVGDKPFNYSTTCKWPLFAQIRSQQREILKGDSELTNVLHSGGFFLKSEKLLLRMILSENVWSNNVQMHACSAHFFFVRDVRGLRCDEPRPSEDNFWSHPPTNSFCP